MGEGGQPKHVIHEAIPIHAAEDTVVSHSPTIVPVKINLLSTEAFYNNRALYYQGELKHKKIYGIDGIFEHDHQSPAVLICSKTKDPKKPQLIKRGDILGNVSSVIQLEEEDDDDTNEWNIPRMKSELNIGTQLMEDEKDRIFSMLTKVRTALGKTDSDIGRAHVTPQTIELTNNTPIYQKPRRFAEPINSEIERQCKELEALDIIEQSQSLWSSPVVPIRKPDGQLRLVLTTGS